MRFDGGLGFAFLALFTTSVAAHAGTRITLEQALATHGGALRPVPEAQVSVFVGRQTDSLIEVRRPPLAQGKTDSDGAVDLDLPMLSGMVLVVDAAASAPLILPFTASSGPEVRLRLEPGEDLSAPLSWPKEALRPRGSACADFRLRHEDLQAPLDFERCGPLTPAGAVLVSGLPPGAQGNLEIRAAGYLPLFASLPLAVDKALRLDPGLLATGTVADPAGRPLVGVKLATREGERVESGEGGRFELRAGGLPLHVEAHAPGFARTEIAIRDTVRPVTVVLQPGATLAATLLGSEGQALPRATVRVDRELRPGAWSPISGSSQPELIEGAFLLDLPQSGRFRAQVRAPGLRPMDLPVFEVADAEAVDFGTLQLTEGGGLDGRVVDAGSGRPLPGVLVRLIPRGMSGLRRLMEAALVEAVTDADGRYRLSGQPPGSYELRFEREGYARAAREVELSEQERTSLDDQILGHGCQVAGVVVDRAGRPRSAVRVKVVMPSGTSLLPLEERLSAADGHLAPMFLSAGTYRVEARTDRPLLAQTFTVPEGEEEVEWTLTLQGATVLGLVRRGEQPVAGGTLRLAPALDPGTRVGKFVLQSEDGSRREVFGPLPVHLMAEVGAEGTFRFEDVPPGPVTATYLSAEGELVERLVDIPPQAEAFVTLDLAGTSLAGQVREAGGEPVAAASLELRDGAGNLVASAVTDDGGAFLLPGLAPGRYLLETKKPGFATRATPGLEPGGESQVLVVLERAETGSLAARLGSPGGGPLSHALVGLFSAGGSMVTSLPLDALGERHWDDLPAGVYYLTWSDPSVGVGASRLLTLDGGEQAQFNQRLAPPAPVALTCSDRSCAGATLQVLSVLTADGVDLAPFFPGFSPGLAFSAEGRLDLGGLAPGRYRLLVGADGRSWDLPLTAQAGAPAVVELGQLPPDSRVASR